MESAGLNARGEVGDHHEPNAALEDALRYFAADEVIISTHPPQKSRWLERGVVERARREVPLPITHVVVDLEAEAAGARRGRRRRRPDRRLARATSACRPADPSTRAGTGPGR